MYSNCWNLNSGPPEEQTMLLTSEPPLQPDMVDGWQKAMVSLVGPYE